MTSKQQERSAISLLVGTTPVTLGVNEQLEGNPMITPMLDGDNNPKTDRDGYALGSIRLEQFIPGLSGSGFLNTRRRVAFIAARIVDLERMAKLYDWTPGSEFTGKIVIQESLVPFFPGQDPKINPNTSEQVGVTVGDRFFPIYHRMVYVEDLTTKDELVRTPQDVHNWYATRNAVEAINIADAIVREIPADENVA